MTAGNSRPATPRAKRSPRGRHEMMPYVPRAPLITAPESSVEVRRRLQQRRRRLVIGIGAGVLFLGFAWVSQSIVHDYRQRHRAAAVAEPKAGTAVGDAIGVIQVPAIELNEVVVEGVGPGELRGGPGRLPGTAVLGQKGAMIILGHCWRYGGPFRSLRDLEPGSEIFYRSRFGTTRAFEVEDVLDLDSGGEIPGFRKERLVLVTTRGGPLADRLTVVIAKPKKGQAAVDDAPEKAMSAQVDVGVLARRPVGRAGAAIFGLGVVVACLTGLSMTLSRRVGVVGVAAFTVPVGILVAVLGVFSIDLILPVTF